MPSCSSKWKSTTNDPGGNDATTTVNIHSVYHPLRNRKCDSTHRHTKVGELWLPESGSQFSLVKLWLPDSGRPILPTWIWLPGSGSHSENWQIIHHLLTTGTPSLRENHRRSVVPLILLHILILLQASSS